MKKLIVVAAFGLFTSFAANAASNVGQCVYPKTNIAKNGHLEFKKPVYIFSSPDAASTKQLLSKLAGFTIKGEAKGFVQLATVTDSNDANPAPSRAIGWAKLSDFSFQDLRNCN
ncbi:hypothetical protein [Collimonas silvisoli]|uniref:hypothetical protein n=1 Tax=Collimonas silvisoli TaxID=2825884 RepID=UPI001B8D54D7|nr:hypothetical protein [Collimonas silvisoli]